MLFGIILGALGAHAMKQILSPDDLNAYLTAVRYQIYGGLSLLILSNRTVFTKWVYRLITLGTLLFSVSIYGLVLDQQMGINLSALGPVTPLGGSILIAGWVVLVINIFREKSTK